MRSHSALQAWASATMLRCFRTAAPYARRSAGAAPAAAGTARAIPAIGAPFKSARRVVSVFIGLALRERGGTGTGLRLQPLSVPPWLSASVFRYITCMVNGVYALYNVLAPTAVLLCNGMVKTNAQRQAEYQRRRKDMLAQCVTPDDVRRAARLLYDDAVRHAAEPQPYEEFLQAARKKSAKVGDFLLQMMSDSTDPEYYDGFAPDDAALLVKVAAVYRAMKYPPAA